MTENTEQPEHAIADAKRPVQSFVIWLFSELMWALRRVPVMILIMISWYSLDVDDSHSPMIMTVCACGYFVVHSYLNWVEKKYELCGDAE